MNDIVVSTPKRLRKPKINLAKLPPTDRAVLVMGATEARKQQLRDLVAQSADIKEITNEDGREQVHRMAMTLADERIAIDKQGKAAREDANDFSKAVIATTKELIGIPSPEEDRLLALRDDWDAARKAEEDAKIAAEQARVEEIQARIERMRQCPISMTGNPSAAIQDAAARLELIEIDDSFAEFTETAVSTHAQAIEQLWAMRRSAVAQEAAAARLQADADAQAQRQRELDQQAERQRQEEALYAKRMARIDLVQDLLTEASTLTDSAALEAALEDVVEWLVTAEAFGKLHPMAVSVKAHAIDTLERQIAAAKQREAQRAVEEASTIGTSVESAESLESVLGLTGSVVTDLRQAPKAPEAPKLWHPTAAEIVLVLSTHYTEERETIVSWLRELDFCDPKLLAAA